MTIIFIGISNKPGNFVDLEPFDPSTASGKIIQSIESKLGKVCLKHNLVNFAPIDEMGKLRYPNKTEIEVGIVQCMEYIQVNSPCLVFLLGKLVEKPILQAITTTKTSNNIYQYCDSILFSPMKHPSYIHTYRKASINDFIDEIVKIIRDNNFIL